MLGELTKSQIKQIVQSRSFGRIACYADGRLYIVPITYAFDGKCIYAHSREGMKIRMMRKNPKICFEVDEVDNMANWRSAILWGSYEELKTDSARQNAMKILMERVMPLVSSETVGRPPEHSAPPFVVEKRLKAIVFRIKVTEMTGRFEKIEHRA